MNYENPLVAQLDPDLMMSRRAFPAAQEAFSGPAFKVVASAVDVGWHETSVHPETGSVALVSEESPFVDLVGEILRVSRVILAEEREVFVYILETAPLGVGLSLARRPFLALGLLANETLQCGLEIRA